MELKWGGGDGKRKKNNFFFGFCVEMSVFFRKNFGARYVIGEYQWLITCRLWNEDHVIRFFVHGKLVVRIFGQTLRFCIFRPFNIFVR